MAEPRRIAHHEQMLVFNGADLWRAPMQMFERTFAENGDGRIDKNGANAASNYFIFPPFCKYLREAAKEIYNRHVSTPPVQRGVANNSATKPFLLGLHLRTGAYSKYGDVAAVLDAVKALSVRLNATLFIATDAVGDTRKAVKTAFPNAIIDCDDATHRKCVHVSFRCCDAQVHECYLTPSLLSSEQYCAEMKNASVVVRRFARRQSFSRFWLGVTELCCRIIPRSASLLLSCELRTCLLRNLRKTIGVKLIWKAVTWRCDDCHVFGR
jgi:hypothetical protein